MKKHSKFISMLLAMLMVVSSLSIAFAVDELEAAPQADDQATATEETAPGAEDAASDVGETTPDAETTEAGENASETGEPVEETTSDSMDAAKRSKIEELIYGLEEQSVTVIIKYVFKKDGKEAAPTVTQEIVLKENSKGVYEGKYSVKSPVLKGYAADKTVVEGTVNGSSANPTTVMVKYSPAPAPPVTNLKLHPAFESIVLTWDRVEDAKSYVVQRSTDKVKYTDIATVKNTSNKEILYHDASANGVDGDFKKARTYYYRVLSVSVTDVRSPKPAEVSGTCVRPMYESITFKESIRLTAHKGVIKSVTFKAGQTVTAQGFGGGKYEFWYKDSYFHVNYVRVKNCEADYQPNKYGTSKTYSSIWARQNYASADGIGDYYEGLRFYDKISAEYFANGLGRSSRTNYLIWVSTYKQHVYVFQGSKGKWKLIKDWECSTGAGQSPTPTGLYDKQLISQGEYRRTSYRNEVRWWSPFQTWNSIHGKRSFWAMGAPASNGCVRNFDQNAEWIYRNCPIGTAVVVW